MKALWICIVTLIVSVSATAQGSLQFDAGKNKAVIPFELINNLIFIEINLNGVDLNFLVDTGVEETVLFSLDDTNEISFENVETIKLRGLGSENFIECMKSSKNKLKLPGLSANNHDIYIILDQDFNFSSHIGIPVNGIIGYQFFKEYIVEVNYDKKKIYVYEDSSKLQKKLKNQYQPLPITVENHKPYVVTSIVQDTQEIPAKLLIDTGSSDAIWLFENKSDAITLPKAHFDDFLGRGFSGDIHGKRARIPKFELHHFKFIDPIAAFPDSSSTTNVRMVENRVGSVGGEILRRFSVIFDYKNSMLYLKKGIRYDDPFQYNMSGIELHHEGLQWVQETIQLSAARIVSMYEIDGTKGKNFKYRFELKPIYCISSVRKDSPADLAGLQKGDIILTINNTRAFPYSLQEIGMLLKSEAGKTIEVEIERENHRLKYKFQLQSVL